MAILAFMTGALIAVYATGSLPNVMNGWGADSDLKICSVSVDTSRLLGIKDKYHLVVLCGMGDPTTDPQDDDRIAISKPFNISGQSTNITAPFGALLTATDSMPPSAAVPIWHSVGLLPRDVNVSEIKSISDLKKRGGRIIVYPEAGGFSNGVHGTGSVAQPSASPSKGKATKSQ